MLNLLTCSVSNFTVASTLTGERTSTRKGSSTWRPLVKLAHMLVVVVDAVAAGATTVEVAEGTVVVSGG